MARKKSKDIKARVPFLYFQEGYKVKDICRILGLGKTLVYQCIQNHAQAVAQRRFARRPYSLTQGRPHIVKHAHVNFIRQLLSNRRSHYLDELQTELFHAFNIHISLPTISRTLHRTSLSRKRLWKQAIGTS
jgi:transposase